MKAIRLRKLGLFPVEWVRSCLGRRRTKSDYKQMAKDEKREREALEWTEATFCDGADDMR